MAAHKVHEQGDDIRIRIYRHTNLVQEWVLGQGDKYGFDRRFELDVNGGEMFFFSLQVSSTDGAFKYDPTAFRVQVYLKE